MLKRLAVLCLCLAVTLAVFTLVTAKEDKTVCECETPLECTSECDVCVYAEYSGLTDTVYCADQQEWSNCCASVVDSVCRWDPDDPIE
jgi:hypothetical protein